ncbi:MAG: preprotein translocase subunit SecG [Bdellovibrionia bacterium]
MQTLVTVIHVMTCILLVLVVLLQSGKGAEISTSLSGSSQTVFGSSGGANFFTRFTSGAAAVFMVTSLTLTLLGGQSKKSLFDSMSSPSGAAGVSSPAAPGGASEANPAPGASSLPTATPPTSSAPQS